MTPRDLNSLEPNDRSQFETRTKTTTANKNGSGDCCDICQPICINKQQLNSVTTEKAQISEQ